MKISDKQPVPAAPRLCLNLLRGMLAALAVGALCAAPGRAAAAATDAAAQPAASAGETPPAESAAVNCDDIDAVGLIVGTQFKEPGAYGLVNLSARLGKAEPSPAYEFLIKDYRVTERKDFCGTPTKDDAEISGQLLIEQRDVKHRKKTALTRTSLQFIIYSDNQSAAVIDGVPYGMFGVSVCISVQKPQDKKPPACEDRGTKPVFCALGTCRTQLAIQFMEFDICKTYKAAQDLETATLRLYQGEGNAERLLAIKGRLPPPMVRAVEQASKP